MRRRKDRKKRIKQNGENTNKIEGKSFEHDVRIVVNKIFD
jgi:hypothetical protein